MQKLLKRPSYTRATLLYKHEPVDRVSERLPVMNIHGRIHEKTHYNFENNRYNVSAENINYTPVRLRDILERGTGWRVFEYERFLKNEILPDMR